MPLRDLTYRDVTRRLDKLGFRFYRQGKGSHELWVRDSDGKVVPVPHHRGKSTRQGPGEPCERSFARPA